MRVSNDLVALAVTLAVASCDAAPSDHEKKAGAAKAAESTKPEPVTRRPPESKPSLSPTEATAKAPSQSSSPATATPSTVTPAAPAAEAPALGVGVEASAESLGELKLGITATRVKELLPNVKPKGKRIENEEAGQFEQSWEADGVRLNMVSEKKDGEQTVEYITVIAPSALKSARGVGIGDGIEAVKKAYGESVEPDLSDGDGDQLSYGGIVFTVRVGKVASIVIGEPNVEG